MPPIFRSIFDEKNHINSSLWEIIDYILYNEFKVEFILKNI